MAVVAPKTKQEKFELLKAIYEFYADFIKGMAVACRKGCSLCCTVNVTATSLETGYLLEKAGDFLLRPQVRTALFQDAEEYYRPSLTTNEIAWHCLKEEAFSDEGIHGLGSCPFLTSSGVCSLYALRPFACRAMCSRTICKEDSGAEMPPFMITVNLALYQIIEFLDAGGMSGNMIDLLAWQLEGRNEGVLLRNKSLPGFLVSPEERGRFNAFMRRLRGWQVAEGRTIADFLPDYKV